MSEIFATSQIAIGCVLVLFVGKEQEHILIGEYFSGASIWYATSLLKNKRL
jgi:hypothetical protein